MFERHRIRLLVALALPVSMVGAGLWALTQLPPGAMVPIHFDADGRVNGWADARWGLFLLPLLAAFTLGLTLLLPALEPRAEKIRQSQRAILDISLAVQFLLTTIQGLIIAVALDRQPDVGRWVLLLVGMVYVVIGNMLGKVRWNHTVGIRTPWTLANERVWDKTHRFGGAVFFVAGLTLMSAALLSVPSSLGVPLMLTVTLFSALVCVIKSWLLWRRELLTSTKND